MPGIPAQPKSRWQPSDASGGDLGLQGGRGRTVEIAGWLRWRPGHLITIDPGQAEQAKLYGSRSFVRALHLDPRESRPTPRWAGRR